MNDANSLSNSSKPFSRIDDYLYDLKEKTDKINEKSKKMMENVDILATQYGSSLEKVFEDIYRLQNGSSVDEVTSSYGYLDDWRTLYKFYNDSCEYFTYNLDFGKAEDCIKAIEKINKNMSSNNPITDEFIDDDLLQPVGGANAVKSQLTTYSGGNSYGGGSTYTGGSSSNRGSSYSGGSSNSGSTRDPYKPTYPTFNPSTIGGSNNRTVSRTDDDKNAKNPYNFNFSELSEEDKLEEFINADLPVFLHGKSGCGKSARIKEIDPDCVILYLAATKPDMLVGKTIVVDGETKDVPPDWYKAICKKCEQEPDKNHILFFDEITNATPAIQGMAYNIILDKVVNGKWKLPDNVKVVAAGNEDKESLSANKLSEPLFRRFNHLYIETTLESWLLWASKHNIHPAIYAFVASKGDGKEQVLRTECNGKEPCVDPRKWEMASKLLYKCKNPKALTATIGKKLTEEFISFCKMPVITLDQVINGEYDENMSTLQIDEGYATLIGLAACNEKDIEVVRKFVKKYVIPDQYQNFVMMWTRGDQQRIDKIRELDMLENNEEKGNVR